MQSQTNQTVDTLSACRSAVTRLESEPLLAVDTEGVHLSRTGPLTLLQVATPTAHVFLFDILREPRMFQDGGLKRLLEDESIVKVLHSAKNDAEALYWQHKVELRNVHDTQVAHRELQRSEGHKFPPRGKLSDVCAVYCPQKTALVDADKDVVATKMNRTDGGYWAKRPLTQEMINYAASDVLALIPEIYTAQKRLLEEKGLTQVFKSRVERELRGVKDPDVVEAMKKEERDTIASTLREFVATAPRTTRFQDITDEEVVEALSILRLNEVEEMGLPSAIRDLKLQQMEAKLNEVEREMQQKGKDYDGHSICRQLNAFVTVLEDHPLKEQAQRVLKQVHQHILDDIKNKYSNTTPLNHVAPYEKKILTRELRPRGEHDVSVNPVLLRLYWMAKLEDLEDMIRKFKADPINFKVSEGYVRMLKFYVSGEVPARLKQRGKEFLVALQDMGKVAPPPQASGRRQGYGARRF